MLGDVPRLLRTIRHLLASQVYWRGHYRLERKFAGLWIKGSRQRGKTLPRVRTDLPTELICADVEPPHAKLIAQLSRGTFEHLNVARELGWPPDWLLGPRDSDRLWIVTLHYHGWAYDLSRIASSDKQIRDEAGKLFIKYISDWIERCDLFVPGARQLAWNAFAIATRARNWIRSAERLGSAWWSSHPDFQRLFLSSLWQQADFLARHLEWDLRGNHLLRNAVGLAWAGRYLAGPQAQRWLWTATGLAADQIEEQILADGSHFERSPMYHRQVMADLLELSLLIEESSVRQQIERTLVQIRDFANWARHPDGGIALLNDSTFDAHVESAPVPRGNRHFANAGLVVWHGAPWSLFFDVGPVGPDDQPGHGHADNLTLECSYAGRRLFVDPGTFCYDRDDRRAYDRSTAAHNTVCVDRTDSSEVWDIFRVGRRAQPRDVRVTVTQGELDARAAHDGYSELKGGGVIHQRRVQVADNGPLVIADRVDGRGRHRLEGGWLLEPGWAAVPMHNGWELRQGSEILRVVLDGHADIQRTVEQRPWHPQFAVEVLTTRLQWTWEGALPFELRTIVEPHVSEQEQIG